MDDRQKTKAQLIDELIALRAEVCTLKGQQQQLISETALSIRNSLNVKDILRTTVTGIRRIMESDRVIILQFQPDGSGLVVEESLSNQVFSLKSLIIPDECFPQTLVEPYRQGRTRTINNVQMEANLTPCHREFLVSLMVQANLIFPIVQQDDLWGLLIAHQCTAPRCWTNSEVQFMNHLAIQVGIAIQQASLVEQMQTELAERQRLTSVLEAAPDFVVMFTPEGKVIWLNRSAKSVLGITDISYFTVVKIHPQWALDIIYTQAIPIAIETGSWTGETAILSHKRPEIPVSQLIVAHKSVEGKVLFISSIMRDMTLYKLAELQLKQMNSELEKRVIERTAQLRQANNDLQRELLQQEQLHRKLRNREKLLDGFFNAASQVNVGLSICDNNLCFLKINEVLAEINGYSIEGYIGKSIIDLIPENTPIITPLLQSVLNDKQPVSNLEIKGTTKSQPGKIRYWLVSYFPILEETESSSALGSIIIEITERKHLELEREKLITIIEATSDFIVTLPFTTQKIEYVNSSGRRFFGLDRNIDVNHLSITDLYPSWALEIVQNQAIPTAIRDGVWVGETVFLDHEGREIPISQVLISQTFGDHQEQYLSTIARDITETKHIEATLQESNRRWESLLDNVELIVIGLDANSYVEYVNPFFLQLTNYSQLEVLGKHWFDNFLAESQQNYLWENNFHAHYQNHILTKSGEQRMISWSNTRLQGLQGNLIGTISIGEDITERYRLERMKSEFVSIVSHELRTPLTSIQAGLSLLNEKIIDISSPEGEATIEIVINSVDRLVRLVNDILNLERLESGKIRLQKSTCQTDDLINTAIAQIQDMANQTGIILNISNLSYQVYADADRILQVLINLIINAIKFSEGGSNIWLSVELVSSIDQVKNKRQKASCDFPQVLFAIRDQGRGIPHSNLESIFKRFHQVDASDSRDKGGTGLGLSICSNIVEQHKGSIWVESVLGEGSTFYFTLPTGEVGDCIEL